MNDGIGVGIGRMDWQLECLQRWKTCDVTKSSIVPYHNQLLWLQYHQFKPAHSKYECCHWIQRLILHWMHSLEAALLSSNPIRLHRALLYAHAHVIARRKKAQLGNRIKDCFGPLVARKTAPFDSESSFTSKALFIFSFNCLYTFSTPHMAVNKQNISSSNLGWYQCLNVSMIGKCKFSDLRKRKKKEEKRKRKLIAPLLPLGAIILTWTVSTFFPPLQPAFVFDSCIPAQSHWASVDCLLDKLKRFWSDGVAQKRILHATMPLVGVLDHWKTFWAALFDRLVINMFHMHMTRSRKPNATLTLDRKPNRDTRCT